MLPLWLALIACEPAPDCPEAGCDTAGGDSDTDDASVDTDDASVDTDDASVDTDDASADTGDASADTGDASVDTGDTSVDTGDASVDTGDASVDTGDTSVDTGDTSVDTGDGWIEPDAPLAPGALRLTVEVWASPDDETPPAPLAGAWLRAEVDLDGDDAISEAESALRTTDERGAWTVDLTPTGSGERLARLSAGAPGFTTAYLTTPVGAEAHLTVRLVLYGAPEVPCVAGACTSVDGRVTLEGLPDGLTPSLRGFHPLEDPQAFPGPFAEAGGDLLLSGGFASLAVTDAGGAPVASFDSDVTLGIELAPEGWAAVVDAVPDNGVIDTPLYRFDPGLGTWVADGTGVLYGADGQALAEARVADVRGWRIPAPVTVKGTIRQPAVWNIDWPRDTITVVRGRLLDEDGQPIPAAVVRAEGVSYIGGDLGDLTDDQGAFCVRGLRSERPGENLDGNSRPGEPSTVQLSAMVGGILHDQDLWLLPSTDDACEGTGGLDLGDTTLGPTLTLPTPLPPVSSCADWVEGADLLDRWSFVASTGGQTTMTRLSPARGALLGEDALWTYTREGFDFQLRWSAPSGGFLDLTDATHLSYAIRAMNPHPGDGWQLGAGQAWVELVDTSGRVARVLNHTQPFDPVYPRDGRTWEMPRFPVVPSEGEWVFQPASGFDRARVVELRLRFDTWEYGFLTVLDALGFQSASGAALCRDDLLVIPSE